MHYLANYAGTLRCIGQVLQNQNIEVFELVSRVNEFHVQAGDPNPPYLGLIEVSFSPENIQIADREAHARRRQMNGEVRFDSLAEVLRAVGEYLDGKRGQLRRMNNSDSSMSDQHAVEIEYETRGGDVQLERLSLSFIREASVRMYKRRTRNTEPVSIFSRRR
jgi:hypothetical protein